jgi:hypothetical protein
VLLDVLVYSIIDEYWSGAWSIGFPHTQTKLLPEGSLFIGQPLRPRPETMAACTASSDSLSRDCAYCDELKRYLSLKPFTAQIGENGSNEPFYIFLFLEMPIRYGRLWLVRLGILTLDADLPAEIALHVIQYADAVNVLGHIQDDPVIVRKRPHLHPRDAERAVRVEEAC